MKKLLRILIAYTLILSVAIPLNVRAADNSVWIQERGKEEWHYTDGMETDLTAKIQDETLYIQGKGAIPNYDKEHLGNRPWHNKPIRFLVIASNIGSSKLKGTIFCNTRKCSRTLNKSSCRHCDMIQFIHIGKCFCSDGCYIISNHEKTDWFIVPWSVP